MDMIFFDSVGLLVGIVLVGLIEVIKRRVARGPMGDFYQLYIHRYILFAELGIVTMTLSFFSAVAVSLWESIFFRFRFVHHVLLVVAMILFMFSARIFLQEVERMLRHRQEEKETVEKIIERRRGRA